MFVHLVRGLDQVPVVPGLVVGEEVGPRPLQEVRRPSHQQRGHHACADGRHGDQARHAA